MLLQELNLQQPQHQKMQSAGSAPWAPQPQPQPRASVPLSSLQQAVGQLKTAVVALELRPPLGVGGREPEHRVRGPGGMGARAAAQGERARRDGDASRSTG